MKTTTIAMMMAVMLVGCGEATPEPSSTGDAGTTDAAVESRESYCLAHGSLCRWIDDYEGTWYCGPCSIGSTCAAADGGAVCGR